MQWYYEKDGGQAGPVEDGELGTLVRAGVIRGDTLVWRDGLRDWEPAHRHVRGLAPGPTPGLASGAALGRNYAERVGMGEALRRFFLNYVNVRGRSNRGEYWWAVLGIVVISFAIGLLESALGMGGPDGGPLSGLFGLATLLPSLTLGVRRLHDIDRTGWWLLAPALPLLALPLLIPWPRLAVLFGQPTLQELEALVALVDGRASTAILLWLVLSITILIWACTRPTPGPNRFG